MRLMRSVTHHGAITAPGLGLNIAAGVTVVDFDQVDDNGHTVEEHLGHLAAGYVAVFEPVAAGAVVVPPDDVVGDDVFVDEKLADEQLDAPAPQAGD